MKPTTPVVILRGLSDVLDIDLAQFTTKKLVEQVRLKSNQYFSSKIYLKINVRRLSLSYFQVSPPSLWSTKTNCPSTRNQPKPDNPHAWMAYWLNQATKHCSNLRKISSSDLRRYERFEIQNWKNPKVWNIDSFVYEFINYFVNIFFRFSSTKEKGHWWKWKYNHNEQANKIWNKRGFKF